MRFSERKGYEPASDVIQQDAMDANLRNSIWNVLDRYVWQSEDFLRPLDGGSPMHVFSDMLWFEFFKKPTDTRPKWSFEILGKVRDYFFGCEWYEVYDFIEYALNYFEGDDIPSAMNVVLELELSAYRFINGVCTDITSKQEIEMLDKVLQDTDFPSVSSHLKRALELLSDREKPDYRNSIKESISAVESLAITITGKKDATLGQALKILEKSGKIHGALKKAFSALYGYTSDEECIRHAMLGEPNLSASDAKFFLLSCTSFINYLKSKLE